MLTVKLSNLKMIIIIQMNRRFDRLKPLNEQAWQITYMGFLIIRQTKKKYGVMTFDIDRITVTYCL